MATDKNEIKINPHVAKAGTWLAPKRSEEAIWLDLNENLLLPNQEILQELSLLSSRNISCYPDYTNLLTLLSDYVGLPINHLLLTNGADQGIELVIKLCFQPGQRVIVPSPIFSYYYQVLDINGVEAVAIPYEAHANGYQFPVTKIIEAIPQADGIILCNPNNPLGTLISSEHLEEIAIQSQQFNIPVIIDEAYYEYCSQTATSLLDRYNNILIIRSFSKYFALAGLRLGYILAKPTLIDYLLRIRGPWDINSMAVSFGEICLKKIELIRQEMASTTWIKTELHTLFNKQGIKTFDSHTNFILVKDTSDYYWQNQLRKKNILTSTLHNYPFSFGLLKNMFRIAIPNPSIISSLKDVILFR